MAKYLNLTGLEYYDGKIKQLIEDELANKLTKTTSARKVYATDNSGNQTTETISDIATPWTVAQRNADGDLLVGANPANNASATPKSYVDAIGTYDFLYQGSNTSGTYNISDISNYRYIMLALKYGNTDWTSTMLPAPYIASELSYGRLVLMNANSNIGSNYRWIDVRFNSTTQIEITGASNITWCVLWGVK